MGVALFSSFHYDEDFTKELLKETGKNPKDMKATAILSSPNCCYDSLYKFLPMDSFIFFRMGITNIDEFNMFDSVERKKGMKRLMSSDVILLHGGNTFFFNRYLKKYGIDKKIIELYNKGKMIIGESAGSIILTPKVDMAQFADKGYVADQDNSGLGLVDFEIKPHGEMWQHEIGLLNNYANNCGHTAYLLKERDIIYVNGEKTKMYGNPKILGG